MRARFLLVAPLVVTALATGAPTPAPAHAAGADVVGTVTALVGGAPLEGIDVGLWLFDELGAPTTLVAGATTGPDGSYTIVAEGECGNLVASDPAGDYAVHRGVWTCGEGQTVDIELAAGGRIAGSVTAAVGGAAVPGACVRVSHAGTYVFGDTVACADGSGNYSSVGLVPGFYTAQVILPPGAAVLPGPPSTPLAVGAGSTAIHDFELLAGGRIQGTVRDAVTDAPLEGVQMWVDGQMVLTEADGSYGTSALAPGTYRVFALAGDAVHLNGDLWDVEVGSVDVTGADLWLETGATITGTVVDHLGAPIPGACVYEYWDEPDHGPEVCADGAGAFTYGGLYEGSTEFVAYADGYHNEIVPVTVPGTVEFVLQPLQAVSGTVTAAVGGAAVGVGSVTLTTVSGQFAGQATVQPDGTFAVDVVAGDYVAKWLGPADSPYADEYLDGAPTPETATPFTVVAGAASPGHDFTLDLGGTINGRVTDGEGAPLAGAGVGAGGRSTTTDGAGEYSIAGLATGDYQVFASGPDVVPAYRGEGFDDAIHSWELIDVGVVLGQPTNDIDFSLERLARITGRVLDDTTGLPLVGTRIAVRGNGGFDETSTYFVELDGTFSFDVPAGTYHVFVGPILDRLGEYANGAHRFSESVADTVAAGEVFDVGDVRLDNATPSVFRPLAAPARLVDTRPGQLGLIEQPSGSEGADVTAPLAAGVVRRFVLTDVAGVPAEPGALALNVTTALHSAKGWVTVYGCASAADPVPATSTVNFPANVNIANSAIVAPGDGGGVCVRASVATHLVLDLTGWFAGGFQRLAEPQRVVDTRAGQIGAVEEPGWYPGEDISAPLVPDEPLVVSYGGRDGIPGAKALAVNLTVVNAPAGGYATVYPCSGSGDTPPTSSTLNFTAGATVANGTIVDPTNTGLICVVSNRAVDVIVDVTGYFEHAISGAYPFRLLDTRPGQQGSSEATDIEVPVAAGSTLFVPAYPYGWAGVALNVVAVNPAADGYLTVWACAAPTDPRPTTSTVNFRTGVNVANGVLVAGGAGYCVYASASTHVIVDQAADTD